ncbi:MAG: efflux transporter outer membrane subunit [Betaproteobacteria bacterium]
MKRGLAMVVVAAALSGCMVGPNYKRPALDLPAGYAEGGTKATKVTVPAQWWSLYGDPVLDELVRLGLERNADVRQAVARVDEAEAALREAHATLLFPLVQGQGGASRSRSRAAGVGTVTADNYSLTAATSFEIDLWGRLRRAELSTRDVLAASQFGRDTVALSLAAAIARTYFAALSLDSQYAASQEILRAADESLTLARKRASGGVASELDVYQAGSLRSQAAAQAKEIARQREAIVHQLGVLSGKLDVAVPVKDVAALPIPPLPPAGLPSELLERRPDVRQAEASLSAATQRIGVARASQFPTLSLTGSFGQQSTELSSLFSSGGRIWSIGANIIGPIIDAGRFAARTEQAEAQARQAEASYQRAVENAFRDVSDALSNVRLAADQETDLVEQVQQARNALRLSQMRYENGYSAYLEVLDAQRTLNQALLAFIRNRQAYLGFTVDLMNALGGGWTPPA